MLVWLAEHLVKYYSGFNVFSYLTFRAIVSLLTALFILVVDGAAHDCPPAKTLFWPRSYVTMARNHTSANAVPPTMGGIMILTAIVVSRAVVGLPVQPVRLVRAGCVGGLRRNWFCRRLPQGGA